MHIQLKFKTSGGIFLWDTVNEVGCMYRGAADIFSSGVLFGSSDCMHACTMVLIINTKNCSLSIVIRFLLNMYTAQQAHVSWNSHFSPWFDIMNGVKQGGVLSPVLFWRSLDLSQVCWLWLLCWSRICWSSRICWRYCAFSTYTVHNMPCDVCLKYVKSMPTGLM